MGAFSSCELKKRDEAAKTSSPSRFYQKQRTHRINNSLIHHALMESDWKTR